MRTRPILVSALALSLAACGGGSKGGGDDPLPPSTFAGSWTVDVTVTSSSCPTNIGTRRTIAAVLVDDGSRFRLRDATELPGNEFVGRYEDDDEELQLSRGRDSLALQLLGPDSLRGDGLQVDAVGACTDGLRVEGIRVTGYAQLPAGDWVFTLTEGGQTLETFGPAPLVQEYAAVRAAAGRLRGALELALWRGIAEPAGGPLLQFTGSFDGPLDAFAGAWTGPGGRSGTLTGARQTGGNCIALDGGTWDFTLRDLGTNVLATFDGAALQQTGCEVVVTWSDALGSLELRGPLTGISGAGWVPSVVAGGAAPRFDVTQGQFATPTSYSGLFDATPYGGTTGTLVGARR